MRWLLDANQLNIAHTCIGLAFELVYKSILALETKSQVRTHKLEKLHRRLKKETRSQLEEWIKEIGWTSIHKFFAFTDQWLTSPDRKYWREPPTQDNRGLMGFTLQSHGMEIPDLTILVRKMLELSHKELKKEARDRSRH